MNKNKTAALPTSPSQPNKTEKFGNDAKKKPKSLPAATLRKQNKSLQRASVLKNRISDYLKAEPLIPTGFNQWENILVSQEKIRSFFNSTPEEWYSWQWQLKNRVTEIATLKELLPLDETELQKIKTVGKKYRWAVSPYYFSLIEPKNRQDPVKMQATPSILEIRDTCGIMDPMDEKNSSPAPAIIRRYPDRLMINVTNCCAMYCRHCQRRRNIGEKDCHTPKIELETALQYVRDNREIRDVLITGGDALLLENSVLDWLLTELSEIPHVEMKRIGTRTPVTLPYRIDAELCKILGKHLPLYINTQFNHPAEITPDARDACLKLARCGIALGNQTVLLKGINNDPFIMRKLNQELLRIMVRPYYLFHAKSVKGTSHFRTDVEEGIEIMEKLRGYTSGLAVPTYIVNSPGGFGKTPLLPSYIRNYSPNKLTIRTWENRLVEYDY